MRVDTNPSPCPTCGRKPTRTVPQNSRYWKLVRIMAGIGDGISADDLHEYFKRKFLPRVEKEFPDLTTILLPMSTSRLPMHRDPENPEAPNWDDYTMAVERWCAIRGVYLQEGDA